MPEDDVIFRLAQLLLLLASVDHLGKPGVSLERLGCYDFLVANPMLVLTDEADPDRTRLLMAGFDGRALSYASPAHRFATRRERLQHDLALLVAYGLAAPAVNRSVLYAITVEGLELAGRFTALYARAYRLSADILVRRLSGMSDRRLREAVGTWTTVRRDSPRPEALDLLDAVDLLSDHAMAESMPGTRRFHSLIGGHRMSTENESPGFGIAGTSAAGATAGLRLASQHERGRRQGIRVVRLRLRGVDRDYEVDFRDGGPEGWPRSLSVIAGAFSTGKSSILEFIAYCLGGRSHPQHPEILRRVRSASLEVELSGQTHVIERAVGEASSTAFVRPGRLGEAGTAPAERRVINPPGDPASLSSFLLSYCGLEGVELREAPNQAESGTDPLSIRDLLWLCYMPNERLDDKNLLFESDYMKRLKLRQVVDVVFGVHDDKAVELGRRVKELEARRGRARMEYDMTQKFLDEQELGTRLQVELGRDRAEAAATAAERAIADLDNQIRAASTFAADLRARHSDAARRARRPPPCSVTARRSCAGSSLSALSTRRISPSSRCLPKRGCFSTRCA